MRYLQVIKEHIYVRCFITNIYIKITAFIYGQKINEVDY
jgi:hypothetical protein